MRPVYRIWAEHMRPSPGTVGMCIPYELCIESPLVARCSAGNEIFSLEVRRWAPDAAARESVPTAPSADPTLMRMVQVCVYI